MTDEVRAQIAEAMLKTDNDRARLMLAETLIASRDREPEPELANSRRVYPGFFGLVAIVLVLWLAFVLAIEMFVAVVTYLFGVQ